MIGGMELRQLRTFEAVARHRSFTRASEELLVAQPAVSQQVRRLEDELGVDLLRRTSRQVALTHPGEVLLAGARRVLAEAASVRDELDALTGLRAGRVAVGALPPMGGLDVPGLVARFHRRHPGVDVELNEDTAARLLALLRAGELDLTFAFLEARGAGDDLDGERLLEEELVVAVARDHPRARRRRVRLAELGEHTLVTFQSGSALRAATDAALGEAGVAPRVGFESNELLTVRAIAARGLAVAIIPRAYARGPGARVVGIPVGPRPLRQPLSLLWRASERLSPAAAAFRDYVRAARQTGSLSSDAQR
jgi:DNA-binding transcriptional LysR family regulator